MDYGDASCICIICHSSLITVIKLTHFNSGFRSTTYVASLGLIAKATTNLTPTWVPGHTDKAIADEQNVDQVDQVGHNLSFYNVTVNYLEIQITNNVQLNPKTAWSNSYQ